jgi:RNAse (barnase) inhibitor barstar
MIIRVDARRLTDATHLHAVLSDAFGFPADYGNNLDALVDCLTHLDDLQAGMSRVHLHPGQVGLLVLDHVTGHDKRQEPQIRVLQEVVAFVNWRRLEKSQAPVLALAYERS